MSGFKLPMRRFSLRVVVMAFLGALALAFSATPALAGDGGVCFDCEQKPPPADPKPPAEDPPSGGDALFPGDRLSLAELRQLAKGIGFARPKLAAAIAMAESSGYVMAKNVNRKPRSTDRGLFQINSLWHPEVSRACAFDPTCNAREALRISEGGRNWRQWATWHNESYTQFRREPRAILRAASR